MSSTAAASLFLGHQLERRIGERSGQRSRVRSDIRRSSQADLNATPLPAEVCESVKRDGGSVFPAPENPGDPNGPMRSVR
jgi:hypothetical protein